MYLQSAAQGCAQTDVTDITQESFQMNIGFFVRHFVASFISAAWLYGGAVSELYSDALFGHFHLQWQLIGHKVVCIEN